VGRSAAGDRDALLLLDLDRIGPGTDGLGTLPAQIDALGMGPDLVVPPQLDAGLIALLDRDLKLALRLAVTVPGVIVSNETASPLRRLLTLERRHDPVAGPIPKVPISTGKGNGKVDVIGNTLSSSRGSPRKVE
jgi:hypothetical protein